MKFALAPLLIVLLSVPGSSGRAASVLVEASSNGFGDAGGTDLPIGCLVKVGTFTVSNAVIAAHRYNVAFLHSNFISFGSAIIGPSYDLPGHLYTTLVADTAALGIENAPLYLWVFNSNTVDAATQHGIFTTTNANWRFPLQAGVPSLTSVDISQVPTNAIPVGAFGTGTSDETGEPLYNLQTLPLATWTLDQFGTNRFTPAVAGPGADPDGDGLNNLLEYGLATDPLTPTPGAPLTYSPSNGTGYVTFARNTNALDANWRVEVTSNLLLWTTLTNVTATQPSPGSSTVTIPDPDTTAPTRFYRLNLSAPE